MSTSKQIPPFPLGVTIVLLAVSAACAQQPPTTQPAAAPREIPLYAGVAPGSEKWDYQEFTRNNAASNVVRPVKLYYPADKAKAVGTAMIVAPGGGFSQLMMTYEGVDIAKRLNAMGVDAFVLKYRLMYRNPSPPANAGGARGGAARGGPAPVSGQKPGGNPSLGMVTTGPQAGQNVRDLAVADGQEAIRLVRQHAADYGVAPNRIGAIGFSAGGMMLMGAIYGPPETRPDFAAIIYGSGNGNPPVPAGAPPLFIAVAGDDQLTLSGCLEVYDLWRKANVPVELHVFQVGAHGFPKKGGGADHFMDRVEEWLNVNNLLKKTVK